MMKCPKISNPNEFVELSHADKGIVDCFDKAGNKYRSYLTIFELDGTELNSYVDVDIARKDVGIRFKYDCDLLREHDLDLNVYAERLP